MALFQTSADQRQAEKVLRDGYRQGSFTAAGYALIVGRLDQIISILTDKKADR